MKRYKLIEKNDNVVKSIECQLFTPRQLANVQHVSNNRLVFNVVAKYAFNTANDFLSF